jgi:hypothetical protein
MIERRGNRQQIRNDNILVCYFFLSFLASSSLRGERLWHKRKTIERMKYVAAGGAEHKQLTWLFHTHYLNVGRRTVE